MEKTVLNNLDKMVLPLFVARVKKGVLKIEDVPQRLQAAVEEQLREAESKKK